MRNVVLAYRRALVVLAHLLMWVGSLLLAVLLRFEFVIPPTFAKILPTLLCVSLVTRTVIHWRLGLFHGLWRYSGARDLRSLLQAAAGSSLVYALVWALLGPAIIDRTFPRSIFILDFAFSILIVGGVRFGIRTVREIAIQNSMPRSGGRRHRLLVIGAGDAGEMLMREIVRIYARRYEPLGFLDDNSAKHGERIHGVPVLGPIADVPKIAAESHVDEIIIAIPSLSGREMRAVLEKCQPTGAHIRTLPGVDTLIDGRVTLNQLTDVNLDDLLRREPIVLDTEELATFLRGRTVMVTGAGGSIGSELCRQICRFSPKQIVLVEQAENSLFHIDRRLRGEFPYVEVVSLICDICDTKRLESIFESARPQVILHAAAHKHVPLMEANPGEAIKNNVFGTRKLADLSRRFGVEKFVMVSTDKAVNPTSVMGVSKRVAEIYVQSLSQISTTQFVTVRFGNVLGSAGSVVPLFQEQIAKGGPVTVTHPDMTRYFMTIPEACQLVLQAGAMGKGGEIFVLDMGEPVKIMDLARDLIRLSGLEPNRDIEIRFSGIRPGEKLFEELMVDDEHVDKTKHPKIHVGRVRSYSAEEIERGLADLHAVSDGSDVLAVKRAFKAIVPEYLGVDAPAPRESVRSPERVSSTDVTLN